MKKIFKEMWNGIPVRARYGICFGFGFVLCGMIQLIKYSC